MTVGLKKTYAFHKILALKYYSRTELCFIKALSTNSLSICHKRNGSCLLLVNILEQA